MCPFNLQCGVCKTHCDGSENESIIVASKHLEVAEVLDSMETRHEQQDNDMHCDISDDSSENDLAEFDFMDF